MKKVIFIIIFLFIPNNAYSNEIEKFNNLIEEIALKKADWYFFGIDTNQISFGIINDFSNHPIIKTETTLRGYLNEKSKNMEKTPVYVGKIFKHESTSWSDKVTAHFSEMEKYYNYEEIPQKAHSVPIKSSNYGNGSLPVPMQTGWVSSLGSYALYINTAEKVKEMFSLLSFVYDKNNFDKLNKLCSIKVKNEYVDYVIDFNRTDMLVHGRQSWRFNQSWEKNKSDSLITCAQKEMLKAISLGSAQIDSDNNQTQDNTKTITTSSKIDINSSLSYWQETNKEKKLELIESYFFKILKVKAQTTEEKNSLIEMSNNIIKCVDSLNLNISIGKAIGQCL